MKKRRNRTTAVILTVAAVAVVLFILLPISFVLFSSSSSFGNVAVIPIEGPITGNGASYLGQSTVSSQTVVQFIEEASEKPQIQAILLEINSPGGSAVASDEIAAAVKKAEKPVVALIREVGASGGYWIASSADHIVANRMSITGSIGVISSYLEFSGLMEEYGVGYERLVAGKFKDAGVPFRELQNEERELFQKKLDTIHDYFIEEVAINRELTEKEVRSAATGEFYLGVEALQLGLVDQLGDKETVTQYLKDTHALEDVNYITYQRRVSFFDVLGGVFSDFFFRIGEGFGSVFVQSNNNIMLM